MMVLIVVPVGMLCCDGLVVAAVGTIGREQLFGVDERQRCSVRVEW